MWIFTSRGFSPELSMWERPKVSQQRHWEISASLWMSCVHDRPKQQSRCQHLIKVKTTNLKRERENSWSEKPVFWLSENKTKSNQEMSNYNSISGPTMLHEFKIFKISNKLRKILSSQIKTIANNQMGILELKNTISEFKN